MSNRWNGKGYDEKYNFAYDLKDGKGIIKEYDYGELIFEGEYVNGRKNGKGKEYKYGELIFEGEYINGRKNGKGKEYDDNGNLIFEGEYLNGEMNQGIMKKYDTFTGKLSFEGEYSNGKKIGKGKNMIFLVEKYLLKENI